MNGKALIGTAFLLVISAAFVTTGDWHERGAGPRVDEQRLDAATIAYRATVSTAWQTPSAAHRDAEVRRHALESWVLAHDAQLRLTSNLSRMRLRDADGHRLGTPLVRIEEIYEIRFAADAAPTATDIALASLQIDAPSAPATAPTPVQF